MALTPNQTAALEQLLTDLIAGETRMPPEVVEAVRLANVGRGDHVPGAVFRVAGARLAAKGMREHAAELRQLALQAKAQAPK